jgi:hypothetical protein
MVKKEHYAEVKADNKFDQKMFDPQYFGKVHFRNK